MAMRTRPLAYCTKLLSKALEKSGRPFASAYLAASARFVKRELAWINEQGVKESDFTSLMALYPELQRVLFIHIPKCGGTSIRKTLIQDYQCAPVPLSDAGTMSQSIDYMLGAVAPQSLRGQLLHSCAVERDSENLRQRFLRVFCGYQLAESPERVFLLGHKHAQDLASCCRRNNSDILLTTVRSPVEMLSSMTAYRVAHTLKNAQRQDSVELLASLELDIHTFTHLASTQPRQLAEMILAKEAPSLASYLTLDGHTDPGSVWEGIRQQTIFIAHMSEQTQMLGQLFGKEASPYRMNSSGNRQGLAAQFAAAIRSDWIAPFVSPDSLALYQHLQSTGIIGFWKGGGTVDEYRKLLQSL